MKLLIITQKVDLDDPVLGFFHRWILELSKRAEKTTVLCLEKGRDELPSEVRVLSLGKESGSSRLKYIFNFYRFAIRERKNYDTVFVHMNEEYVLLGGLLWKLLGKKVALWRNHPSGNIRTRLAAALAGKVYCTSRFSFTARFRKTELMPVGVDMALFRPATAAERIPDSILFLGRIAPVKRPDMLLSALVALARSGGRFIASFYGDPLPKDRNYYEQLRKSALDPLPAGKVAFHPGIPNSETPPVYRAHEIFANLSPSGMYDKTIFEAMGSGCLILASNENLRGEIDERLIVSQSDGAAKLAERIEALLRLPSEEREALRRSLAIFAEKHSIEALFQRLSASLSR